MTAASKTRATIEKLRTLIDHPRTGASERDAARRMLKRVLAKAAEQGEALAGGYQDHRVYGEKYAKVRHLGVVDIAKHMRADIKLALKIAKADAAPGALAVADPFAAVPDGLKITVRTRHASAIDIVLRNVPDDWGWTQGTDRWGRPGTVPTPALQALADALKAIHAAYNYDGSDLTTDFFDRNYYGGVVTDRGLRLA
ncbi:hypothetical protein H114_32574 [Streptomyces gancidicus BKS 13-15]|uniref:Uncharacterized protein n=1 Tax=Streptomyces gancidicus BKS 13-15 TaxID=1284664 RepID=M3DG71_STREZ|nr:hypothetical protein [Streptomyces gancidicus]EMF20376.1 hypothetical protein H114_32574 [Streptomyces gancidicus BKS 13-15]